MGFTRDPTIEELHPPGGLRKMMLDEQEEESEEDDAESLQNKYRHKFVAVENIRKGNVRVRKIANNMTNSTFEKVVDICN